MDIFIARQPILDRKRRLFAYEVLYRDSMANTFSARDGDGATSSVLAHSILNLGLERIVGTAKAFINFTEKHLVERTPQQLPPDGVVVEVLETVPATPEVIAACRTLKARGYTIALDDFFFAEGWQELISIADIIKVDILDPQVAEDLAGTARRLLDEAPVKLLAEKVETYEQFTAASTLGFSYFQGYFFSRPEVLKHRGLGTARIMLLELLSEISRRDLDTSKIERIITADVSLSYKLLRYINSAFYSLVSQVKSIRHALAYLGESGIRQFVALATIHELAVDKPTALMQTAMIRAYLCRLLGQCNKQDGEPSEFFLLGLFSLLDAMLDAPMPMLLDKLPLTPSLKEALIGMSGSVFAPYLAAVKTYERGNWTGCQESLGKINISPEQMTTFYLDALAWTQQLLAE